jgi:hypothetical protein
MQLPRNQGKRKMDGEKIAIYHCYTKNTLERKNKAKATIRKFLIVRMVPLLATGKFSMDGGMVAAADF